MHARAHTPSAVLCRSPADVLETFNFLENTEDSDEDEDEDGDLMDDISPSKQPRSRKHRNKVAHAHTPTCTLTPRSSSCSPQVGNEGLASEEDADTEEALKEFDFLVTAEDGEGAGEARSSGDGTEWGESSSQSHAAPLAAADAPLLCLQLSRCPSPPPGARPSCWGARTPSWRACWVWATWPTSPSPTTTQTTAMR